MSIYFRYRVIVDDFDPKSTLLDVMESLNSKNFFMPAYGKNYYSFYQFLLVNL